MNSFQSSRRSLKSWKPLTQNEQYLMIESDRFIPYQNLYLKYGLSIKNMLRTYFFFTKWTIIDNMERVMDHFIFK